jgi:hypothetical protein
LANHHITNQLCLTRNIQTWKVEIENFPSDKEGAKTTLFDNDSGLTEDLGEVVEFIGSEFGLAEVRP